MSQAQTQTSPDNATTAMKGHFSIGAAGTKEERLSPKLNRKDHGKGLKTRFKRAMSPANSHQVPSTSHSVNLNKEKVKEAVSPSVAECLRAVFAAYLWHEGIVHDAMACASFLKFHPGLPKQGALVVTRQSVVQPNDKQKQELTKEQKARQRHSVEVSNAGNYLHIQPSTLETLTRSAANANANRSRKKQENIIKEEGEASKLTALPEFHTVAILPPALKCLVFLWEELSTNCLQVINQQNVVHSPVAHMHTIKLSKKTDKGEKSVKEDKTKEKEKKTGRKKKEWKPVGQQNVGESLCGIERETTCELCGLMFPHPVTYHMKMMHPGCGWHAGGKGYNSGGNYCVGWAGNCGDGGIGGSSWYLICDTCREKYLKTKKNKLSKKLVSGVTRRKGAMNRILSPINSPSRNETHIVMKNNAMFLLDLASASGLSIPKQQRRPSQTLSSVAENYSPPEPAGPFPPTGPFQCLQALGIHNSQSHDERYYEETLRRHSGQHNPFEGNTSLNSSNGRVSLVEYLSRSFIDFDSVRFQPLSECPVSDSDSDSGKGRGMFHRSVSMSTGAPWARNSNDGRVVMMRKRNNSSSEMNNGE